MQASSQATDGVKRTNVFNRFSTPPSLHPICTSSANLQALMESAQECSEPVHTSFAESSSTCSTSATVTPTTIGQEPDRSSLYQDLWEIQASGETLTVPSSIHLPTSSGSIWSLNSHAPSHLDKSGSTVRGMFLDFSRFFNTFRPAQLKKNACECSTCFLDYGMPHLLLPVCPPAEYCLTLEEVLPPFTFTDYSPDTFSGSLMTLLLSGVFRVKTSKSTSQWWTSCGLVLAKSSTAQH